MSDRISFETAAAAAYDGNGYDLVAMFDCLHDMGDRLVPRAMSAERSSPTALG